MLCAVHCALWPLLLALLPTLGFTLIGSASFERLFVAFASTLALTSLWQGYRRHRIYRAWLFVLPGLSAVWAGILYPPLHHSIVAHAVAMTFGGTMIAIAHLINLKLTHGHVHDRCCAH